MWILQTSQSPLQDIAACLFPCFRRHAILACAVLSYPFASDLPSNRVDLPPNTSEFASGQGTFVDGDVIYASILGSVQWTAKDNKIQVVRVGLDAPHVPAVGDVVFSRVTRINKRMCTTEIVQIGDQQLPVPFQGVIRVQDVRATEIDKVLMDECFRPGDVVRARVLSLGTMREYFLTTAKPDLGVVSAVSTAEHSMIPVNWESMRCPESGNVEKRKVANFEQPAN
eukprot:jgi/Ulvmu1/2990/UM015_0030.1